MSESRVFMLNGTNVQSVVTRLENFFQTEKGMEVQSSQTTDGYVMQASQPKDGWKTLTGMRLAVTVQMAVMENGLNVTVGEGQWSDKIGAGAIGLFVAWPLAITAGMGAFKQKKLPAEISGNRKLHHVGRSFHCRERCGTKGRRGNDSMPRVQSTDCRRIKILQSMRRQA